MSTHAAIADHVRARLGADVFAPGSDHTDAYAAVLAPHDAAGVAAALALCTTEGWPVRVAGAGTWPGEPPARPAVLISTSRLGRITEYEPADLVIGVEAGVTLERLNAQLALNGQWLPLDPAARSGATIGAVAALGASGPLRAGYGTPRDMVLGLEVATADGRLVHFGGRVVKNVAGYDGVRLLVGSRGTLGVITSLYLRVRGKPHVDRSLVIGCESADRASDVALRVRDAVACDALELLSPALSAAVGAGSIWTLLVRVTGGEAAVQESVARIHAIAVSTDAPLDVWSRVNVVEAAAPSSYRLSGPATSLRTAIEATNGFVNSRSDNVFCAAHAADGVVRVWPGDAMVPGDLPPDWMLVREPAGAAPPSGIVVELTSRIRSVFDPAGILVAT